MEFINKKLMTMIMMMLIMVLNCFCGMIDQQKTLELISNRNIVRDPHHCESLTGFELEQDLNFNKP